MHKLCLVALIGAFAFSFQAHAQFLPGPPKSEMPGRPFFSVETDLAKALTVSDVKADVSLKGAFAETVLDIAYKNSTHQSVQGLFKIQLPNGSLVRDFALRIGEKWQYRTLTEKHKARETFEEIVRRGDDPAVLAWKDGAEYQVRIFPFPANGKRWIRVKYWQDLNEINDRFAYSLPLPQGLKLDSFSLKLEANATSLSGVVIGEAYAKRAYLKPIAEDKTTFGAMLDEKSFVLPGSFNVAIAEAPGTKGATWTAVTKPKGDMPYVGARWFQELPRQKRAAAKTWLAFIDTSRSSKPTDLTALAKFLEKVKISTGASMKFYEFNSAVSGIDPSKLSQLDFDGGTNFKAVFDEIQEQQKKAGSEVEALIVSDAVPTMQKESELMQQNFSKSKIHFLPASSRFNPHFAAKVAERSGGTVLPLIQTASLDSAVETLLTAPWIFSGLVVEGGVASDAYPEQGSRLDFQEGAYVYFRAKSGRLPKSVTVTVSNGSKSQELKADFTNARDIPQVEQLWAMKKLMSLVPQADEYEKELMAHATRYQLVSPKTSFIVLELESDYQQFNLTRREDSSDELAESSDLAEAGESAQSNFAAAAPRPSAKVSSRSVRRGEGGGSGAVGAARRASDIAGQSAIGFGGAESDLAMEEPAPMAAPASAALAAPPPPFEMKKQKEAEPSSVSAESVMQHYFADAKSLRELRAKYTALNKAEMNDPWFFIESAQRFAQYREKSQALRALSNLFEISEEDGKAIRALGLLGCFEGHCEWAVQAFRLAIDLRPEEPQNYRDLAWLFLEMGDSKQAMTTFELLKGKKFHARFPGMDQLLAREQAWIKQMSGDRLPASINPALKISPTYSWITWNNDNSDVDFHIYEKSGTMVYYGHRNGEGELSSDFTQGLGPETYASKSTKPKLSYFVKYFRNDRTNVSSAVIMKFSTIESWAPGKIKVSSKVVPLYGVQDFVKLK